MKLTDFTPQIAVSPTAVGVGGGEQRGGALQPLTSPSPSTPEVATPLHYAAFEQPHRRRGAAPRRGRRRGCCGQRTARGPGNGRWGRQGVEWRDDVMQSE